ncbi:MAG: preprotein translocase subunit SecA [Clostridiales bacterium]|nr:preprotein translocase subunit SecA [Clostridiales bacterium]
MGLISFITGSDNRKHLKKLEAIAYKVEEYDEAYRKLTDDELKAKTEEFKRRLKENYETLDDILPEAFATVREASARVLGMRHFHVQILGGITLHQGRIAEMRTGEGKTLVSTLPAYLNALSGEGVHIVTVNDYLAKRDAEWMGKVHRFLGLTVGVAISGMTPEAKRAAYNCDITYATNNELGFDYLRDNMVIYKEEMVQRKLSYAIIDEVDSILIDEARTPLIISGRGEKSSDLYIRANQFVKREIKEDDYEYDEKKKGINLTESGARKAELFFGIENLADIENSDISHHVDNALRAHKIMKRDQDYIVSDGEVVIVDEFTGRLMVGRRYSDGLHQAIEAKENVTIRNENKTLATITFQNYFRLYDKLGGMTGTAKTEETEFKGIYGLDVVEIPTNVPSQRVDENDVIYTTVNGKLRAVIADIKECTDRGQPVLVGTTNVEKSEELSRLLNGQRIQHNVLNAKNHEKEAEIIAQAGRVGAVTIATNMAGRGTDILLGGNPEFSAKKRMRDLGVDEKLISAATAYFTTEDADVLKAREQYKKFYDEYKKEADEEKEKVIAVGGLRIIGTERHESRRIDNQLRGRAGRQGDIGSSIFYLSMEDDLLRLFGGDRMKRIAEMFHADEDTPFSMKLLTKQIANAQRNVEGRNYSIRKQVLEYDNVMNTQRTIIYKERNKVLQGESVHEQIDTMMHEQIEAIVDTYTDPKTDWNEWEYEDLNKEIERKLIPGDTTFLTEDRMEKWALEEIKEQIYTAMQTYYTQKVDDAKELGVDFEEIERVILLKVVDKQWMDHIDSMDALRRGIGLKAYGQQDPVIAYKQEGFAMFDEMINRIHEETVALLMRVNVERAPKREGQNLDLVVSSGGSRQGKAPQVNTNANKNVGRNDPCPCGSGKKYKNCCWEKDHK